MTPALRLELTVTMDPQDWKTISTAGESKFIVLEHTSGWRITHCGHATASWPYYLTAPRGTACIVSHNGRGFKSRQICKEIVSKILAGVYRITTENCCPNIATVENVTATGELIGNDGRPSRWKVPRWTFSRLLFIVWTGLMFGDDRDREIVLEALDTANKALTKKAEQDYADIKARIAARERGQQ